MVRFPLILKTHVISQTTMVGRRLLDRGGFSSKYQIQLLLQIIIARYVNRVVTSNKALKPRKSLIKPIQVFICLRHSLGWGVVYASEVIKNNRGQSECSEKKAAQYLLPMLFT